jgi:hypothetical protein
MKYLMRLLTVLILISCSTKNQSWDAGAKKNEAMKDEARQEQQEDLRNESPAGRTF